MTVDAYVSAKELAKLLGVHEQTIRNWVRSGAIPPSTYIKPGVGRRGGGVYRFNVEDVVAALKSIGPQGTKTTDASLPVAAGAERNPTTNVPIVLYTTEG